MVGGGYVSITGVWEWDVVLASIPYAIGPTIVLFGKHIDKIPWDSVRGVRTLPVLLGHKLARFSVLALILFQFLMLFALVAFDFLAWPVLITLLGATFLLKLFPVYLRDTPAQPPADYPSNVWPLWYSAHAFVHCRRFGILYMLGLLGHLYMKLG